MSLKLAIVESCGPEGCAVRVLDGGQTIQAAYSALVLNRVKIYPGQMVAVNFTPAVPEISWRWYRLKAVEVTPESVTVDDRGCRQLNAARVPGLENEVSPGEIVWVTGIDNGIYELHDRDNNGEPAQPERLRDLVLPRIVERLSAAPAA